MYVSHLLDFNMNDVVSFNIKYYFLHHTIIFYHHTKTHFGIDYILYQLSYMKIINNAKT